MILTAQFTNLNSTQLHSVATNLHLNAPKHLCNGEVNSISINFHDNDDNAFAVVPPSRFINPLNNVEGRSDCSSSTGNDSVLWTLEEDTTLCDMQKKYGNDWALIARYLPNKSRVDAKIRFRSITRAAKKYWTEEQNIELLNAYAENNYTWSDDILSKFPSRTKNCVKLHLQRLLKVGSGVKESEIVPIGSPKQVLIHRPEIAKLLFAQSIKAPANQAIHNKNEVSANMEESKVVFDQKPLLSQRYVSNYQDQAPTLDPKYIYQWNVIKTEHNVKINNSLHPAVTRIENIINQVQKDDKCKKHRKRQKTLNALMNYACSSRSQLPIAPFHSSITQATPQRNIIKDTSMQTQQQDQDDSLFIDDADLERLINILS